MNPTIDAYWRIRLDKCQQALEKNNFQAYVAASPADARRIVVDDILPAIQPKSASWGDSQSLYATGILDELRKMDGLELIETFDPQLPEEQIMARRRQGLQADLFFAGTNALTDSGQLVNLDMIGNRVAGITFGPRHVVLIIGRNKLCVDLPAAMARVKQYAAPANAIRHPDLKTPCRKTAACMDCKSPDRICNVWTITEKAYPKGRIKVVLVNQDLGL